MLQENDFLLLGQIYRYCANQGVCQAFLSKVKSFFRNKENVRDIMSYFYTTSKIPIYVDKLSFERKMNIADKISHNIFSDKSFNQLREDRRSINSLMCCIGYKNGDTWPYFLLGQLEKSCCRYIAMQIQEEQSKQELQFILDKAKEHCERKQKIKIAKTQGFARF